MIHPNAVPYVDPIPPTSEDYHRIRMAEIQERTAIVGRLTAAIRELPPMATGDPPMHPVARAMIAVADEVMAHYSLTNTPPEDPQFPHTAVVEEKARADAREAVRVAIEVVKL
jgi:hypothetical protein